MVVGVSLVEVLIPGMASLKEKRHVLSHLKEKVRAKFNVSIAEVGKGDIWGRAVLGIAVVGNDSEFINKSLDRVMNFIGESREISICRQEMEIINFNL